MKVLIIIAVLAAIILPVAAFAGLDDLTNVLRDVGGKAGLPGGNTEVSDVIKVGSALVKATDNELGPVEEFYLGREVAARLLAGYQPLPQDSPVTQYVTTVGATLALASRMPYPYRPYTFIVLQTNEMNAFAAPGGIIFITTGLLKFLKNEDELAGVLGHEVAHVELRHGVNALKKEGKLEFLNTTKNVAISEVGGGSAGATLFDKLSGPVIDSIMNSVRDGYSVEQESEADSRSLEICSHVGYDYNAFVNVLTRFKSATSSYGGAKYPQDREVTAREHGQTLKSCDPSAVELRAERFASAMKGL